MDIADWVRYNHAVRELYFDSLVKLTWEQVVRPRGISFDNIRNVFIHLTFVEDRWINYTILCRFKECLDPDFNNYNNFYQLQRYMISVKDSTEKFLKTLTVESLKRTIVVPWGDKPDLSISVETGLSHMVMEDLVHYGELSAMLWQMDKEPPYLAFWRYMVNKEHLTL